MLGCRLESLAGGRGKEEGRALKSGALSLRGRGMTHLHTSWQRPRHGAADRAISVSFTVLHFFFEERTTSRQGAFNEIISCSSGRAKGPRSLVMVIQIHFYFIFSNISVIF